MAPLLAISIIASISAAAYYVGRKGPPAIFAGEDDFGGLLDQDKTAGFMTGPGDFIVLGWTGHAWRWGKEFHSPSLNSAMNTMRLRNAPGEKLYLFRWIPTERRWGRAA